MSTLIAFPVMREFRYTLRTGCIYPPPPPPHPRTGCGAECAGGVTGPGGRHRAFSLEETQDQEGQEPGGYLDESPCLPPRWTPDKQVSQSQRSAWGGSLDVWTSLVLFRVCCVLSFLPAPMPSQCFTVSRMLLSLMKTGCRNLSCPGERGHWNASRWGDLLTSLRVSSLTFGFSRLVLATYHGPCSRAGAVGTAGKGRPSWRSSQSGLGTY